MAPRLRRLADGPIADTTRRLAIEHPDWSPTQVHKAIETQYGKAIEVDGVPSLRTVQRFLADFSGPDESGPWSLAEGDPDDAALVLPMLRVLDDDRAELARHGWGVGQSRRPTRAQAGWVVRIKRAAPDLTDDGLILHLAAVATRGGWGVETVQRFLAYAPWRDDGEALAAAIHKKVVGFDVAWIGRFEDPVGQRLGDLRQKGDSSGKR